MAGSTSIYGIPYPQASDLVAAYPALGEDLAEKVDEKLPRYQATAPSTPSVGQIWIDSDDDIGRVWDGAAWIPFSSAGGADFSDAATGTYSAGGINYKFKTYTGSGTLTVTKEGFADILVVAGGGGGGSSGGATAGGGAGCLRFGGYSLAVATYTVTIGAGGAGTTTDNTFGTVGGTTSFGTIIYNGGGNGGFVRVSGPTLADGVGGGGSGGGISGVGAGSVGGGAGGTLWGGANSYNGITVDYDNTATERALGGYTTGAGAANTGNGGGTNGTAGGSGVIIVRVRTS